ncbi:small VCP interacting protein [Colletes latitarsis]|uniref:small VCP interacting protein n=1 Tax=Colletes latitarsis TaxID=2605962 RepID=UPI0040373D68
MGNICTSCFKQSSSYEDVTPDVEVRRMKQIEAAERRLAQQQSRGIKNMDAVRRQEMLDQQRDKRMEEASSINVQPTLKWQV